jgi:uncharacterized membrane protein YgaE (UPF0421/DUF939 family)
MEIFHVLVGILGVIGGLTGSISFFIFIRQNKRIKIAEADKSEIDALRSIIDGLSEENKRLSSRIEEQEKKIQRLEKDMNSKDKEIAYSEKRNIIFERAITCKVECEIPDEKCPIIGKLNFLTKSN